VGWFEVKVKQRSTLVKKHSGGGGEKKKNRSKTTQGAEKIIK